jgi:hypothetical protein
MSVEMETRTLVRWLAPALCVGAVLFLALDPAGERSFLSQQLKVVFTAIAAVLFSLSGGAGSRLARERPQLALLGVLTAIASLLAFCGVAAAIWAMDGNGRDSGVIVGVSLMVPLALGYVSHLLAVSSERDSVAVHLAQGGTVLALAILVLLGIVEISAPGPDVSRNSITDVGVLFLLGAALVPVLRVATGPETDESDPELG